MLSKSFNIIDGNVSHMSMSDNEMTVFGFLRQHFNYVVFKQPLQVGNRIYRPGMVLHFPEHPLLTIVVEVDENYHKDRDVELEARRMRGIMQGFGEEYTYIIRFNPSAYFDNKLRIGARLKTIYNKIKQIQQIDKYTTRTNSVAMSEHIHYLFYPEDRVIELEFEYFAL